MEDQLLTLKKASELIGANPSALRYWANKGLAPFVLTPGGHRRFKFSEIKHLINLNSVLSADFLQEIEDKSLVKVKQLMEDGHMYEEQWIQNMSIEVRERFQLLGRRLMGMFVRWALGVGSSETVEQEARIVGRQQGNEMNVHGVSLTETLTVFAFFRNAVRETVPVETWDRLIRVNDQVMIGIAESYEKTSY